MPTTPAMYHGSPGFSRTNARFVMAPTEQAASKVARPIPKTETTQSTISKGRHVVEREIEGHRDQCRGCLRIQKAFACVQVEHSKHRQMDQQTKPSHRDEQHESRRYLITDHFVGQKQQVFQCDVNVELAFAMFAGSERILHFSE